MTRRQFVGAIVFASLAYGVFLAGGIFFPGARVLAADKTAVLRRTGVPRLPRSISTAAKPGGRAGIGRTRTMARSA